MTVLLVCPTCPDPFPAPVDASGVITISPSMLSQVQTSQGARWLPLCPQCADALTGTAPPTVSPV